MSKYTHNILVLIEYEGEEYNWRGSMYGKDRRQPPNYKGDLQLRSACAIRCLRSRNASVMMRSTADTTKCNIIIIVITSPCCQFMLSSVQCRPRTTMSAWTEQRRRDSNWYFMPISEINYKLTAVIEFGVGKQIKPIKRIKFRGMEIINFDIFWTGSLTICIQAISSGHGYWAWAQNNSHSKMILSRALECNNYELIHMSNWILAALVLNGCDGQEPCTKKLFVEIFMCTFRILCGKLTDWVEN